jgi:hypothetical protein
MHQSKKHRVIVVATLTVVGCASPKAPTKDVNDANGAIRAAQEVGAHEDPQAALHLTLARESLAKAEELIAREQMTKAALMVSRARADAELALALARLAKTRAEAKRVARQVRIFEQEALRRASR